MNRTKQLALLAVLSVAAASYGDTMLLSSTPVPLSDLVNGGGSITVGDKTFTNFTYSSVGDMPPASAVNVIPILLDGDNGLRFQAGFLDMPGNGGSDALITFSVSAPGPWIEGAVLAGNVDAASPGIASITETFLPDFPTGPTLTITSGINLTDSATFGAPVQTLRVQKDILLRAETGPATLSFVDQAFPQVPEPSAALLAAFGLLGLFFSRRR